LATLVMLLLPVTGICAKAPAKSDSSPVMAIGVIDFLAVQEEYRGVEEMVTRVNALGSSFQSILSELELGLGLPEADFKDYVDRTGAAVKVDEARIKELQETARKNIEELQTLKNIEEAKQTDEQKARSAQLEKDYNAAVAVIQQKEKSCIDQFSAERDRCRQVVDDMINKAIEKVAADKKLSLVVLKDFPVGRDQKLQIVWGGTDITADVVKYLNESFKPEMLDKK
jgi:Skp family chaperone for outer membrane proteins